MALSLPRCTPPESLHRLCSTRQRLSGSRLRKSARAKHGTTEGMSNTQVATTDHVKVPSMEPCCKISSLVIVPKKHVRRSSRLRVKRGREDAKAEIDPSDMEAAEWVSRVLANNGMVEIDPMTIAEQISADKTGSTNTHNRVASLTTASEVPDYFPPSNGGLPRVPFGVLLAAASAVVLATVAVLVQSLRRQKTGADSAVNRSDTEGRKSASEFTGEPVQGLTKKTTIDKSSQSPRANQLSNEQRQGRNLPDVATTSGVSAGAAILTTFDPQPTPARTGLNHSSMPLPPSLSKTGSKREIRPHEQQKKPSAWDSVTPFFPSDRSSVSPPRPAPSNPSWPELKYQSVAPFFPSDQSAAISGPRNASLSETATPFFPDEQGIGRDSRGSLDNVAPFFSDEQVSKQKNGASLETVTPFFPDEQARSAPGVSQSKAGSDFEKVTPFFPDEARATSEPGVSLRDQDNGSGSTGESSRRLDRSRSRPSQFRDETGFGDAEGTGADRDSLADTISSDSMLKMPKMLNFRKDPATKYSQFTAQTSVGDERVFAAAQHRGSMTGSTEERLSSNMGDVRSFRGEEVPSVEDELSALQARMEPKLSPQELALLAELKAEEERQYAKYRALQAAFPAIAIGAGALGALVGVDGAFEMVGLTATASFISYELLWANKRKELAEELSKITDHNKLFRFLRKRKIVKDC